MTVIDKFNKTVKYIPGKTTWNAKQWAIVLFDCFTLFGWGVPKIIISDRDRKFVSDFWKHIFESFNVNFLYFATWHPQTDGMSERSNQIAEIAIRYYIAFSKIYKRGLKYYHVCFFLNNSINYNSTAQTFNQMFYGFKPREILNLFRFNDPETKTNVNDPEAEIKINAVSVFPNRPIFKQLSPMPN